MTPAPLKQGDTVKHQKTGEVAVVLAEEGVWLKLDRSKGPRFDPSVYWRKICK